MSSLPIAVRSAATFSHQSPVVFIICGDNALQNYLEGLAQDAGWRVETGATISALSHISKVVHPSCLVLDISHMGPDDQLPVLSPTNVPVICITSPGNVVISVQAMKAGAVDVLTKPVGRGSFLEAIRIVLQRGEEAIKNEAELRLLRDSYSSLSRREREVMALVVFGLMNKQIGWELGISEITVKAHRGRVMRNMKAQSLAHLVIMALKLEIADLRSPHQSLESISVRTKH